jgi:PAS domain S-box-containing protein
MFSRRVSEEDTAFRSLFAGNPLPMWIYDLKTLRFLDVNEAAVAQYGYTRDEFLAMRITDIRPPEDVPRLLDDVARRRAATQQSGEWRHRLKTGGLIDVDIASHTLEFDGREAALVIAQNITDRKRGEFLVRRQLESLTALNDSARQFSESLDLRRLTQDIVRACVESFGLRLAAIAYADGEGALHVLAHHPSDTDYPIRAIAQWNDSARSRGITARVLRSNTPLIVQDISTSQDPPPWWPAALAMGIRSAGFFPLISRTRIFGLLNLYSDQPDFFTPERTGFFTTYGHQAAAALANARLYEDAEQRLRQVQALREIDQAITSSLDLRLTLAVFLDKVTSQLRVDAASVMVFQPKAQTFDFAANRGFRTAALRNASLRLGQGHAGRAALERRRISIGDLTGEPGRFARDRDLGDEGFVAYHAVPLIAKGQVKGVLEVFHRSPLAPDHAWFDFLDALAGQAAIAVDSAMLLADLQAANDGLSLAYDRTLEGWSRALDLRDKETEGHSERVTALTLHLARALHVPEEDFIHMRRGALLHDIGKMAIPDRILQKPGPLTDEEMAIMRRHPEYARGLLAPIDYLRPALDIPYCHHEKWDGSGYPRGLRGEQIPLAARIFAVADVWDALRSDRPYRESWAADEAREYIRKQAGSHFDPRVVEIFERLEL